MGALLTLIIIVLLLSGKWLDIIGYLIWGDKYDDYKQGKK